MTARGLYTLLFGGVMMLTSLSVGSASAFLLGVVALSAFFLSLLGVFCAFFSCRLTQAVSSGQAVRGGSCLYTLSLRILSPVPIAPAYLCVCLPSGKKSEFMLPLRLFGETASDNRFSCPHVGVFPVGVTEITLGDCFGLFSLSHSVRQPLSSVTVLPDPRPAPPLAYSPGEGESSMALRAHADRTTPADTRSWQEGDDLKRVHWKLSLRRQELMVHTYETPQRPDALILLDCSSPAMPDGSAAEGAARANIIDALTESTAGILKNLLESRRLVRMPLAGERTAELSGQDSESLSPMLLALAQESFVRTSDFVRILLLSSRRMQRTGSTVVLSSRLTPPIADAVISLAQMGPHMRFVLVSGGSSTDTQQQLLKLLQASGVETDCIIV